MYIVCPINKKAQIVKSVDSVSHTVHTVSSRATGLKIECYLKGVWGVSSQMTNKRNLCLLLFTVFVKFAMFPVSML